MTTLSRTNAKRVLSKELTGRVEKEKESNTFHIMRYSHQQRILPKFAFVYDASTKTKKTSLSMNKWMSRGLVILEGLCGLLLIFWMKRIGIIADIEKAFLQVFFQPKKRDVNRFLWLKDVRQLVLSNKLVIYRLTRILFGVIFSPFFVRCDDQVSPDT